MSENAAGAGSAAGERPRPRYGEYASPEQQAKAMGTKSPPPPSAPRPVTSIAPPLQPYGQNLPAAAASGAPRRWDLTLSAILLAYGLFSVISGLFQYADLGSLINRVYATQGVTGTFAATQLAGTLGIVINVSDVILFVATALITFSVLRRGRIAFYIPLIGGAVAGLIAAVCVVALMIGDPSFVAYVRGLQ